MAEEYLMETLEKLQALKQDIVSYGEDFAGVESKHLLAYCDEHLSTAESALYSLLQDCRAAALQQEMYDYGQSELRYTNTTNEDTFGQSH